MVVNLTAALNEPVMRIMWPYWGGEIVCPSCDSWFDSSHAVPQYSLPDETVSKVVFSAGTDATRNTYLLNLADASIRTVTRPVINSVFVGLESPTSTALFYTSGGEGTALWSISLQTQRSTQLMAANQFLREIAAPEVRTIEYSSSNGEDLTAKIVLPPGYKAGDKYPVVVCVYPVPIEWRGEGDGFTLQDGFNLLAAHGYVVLIPSVPLVPPGDDDLMLRLPGAVFPAIQKVVELGIGDPNRLFLVGHSWGGYSTLALLTQSSQFKAAVSSAGLSDLVSAYGIFSASTRYNGNPLGSSNGADRLEYRFGKPPWEDFSRYVRNSPIFYVDRVQTPVLIVQGDLDPVGIEQGEEFFSALNRQGKRAQFLRYWGEGHVLENPANIRDMWRRIFDWFGEFSKPSSLISR
jgi:dipeptidyl aminopeptidase/acylaminoacyl peptidase